MQTEDGNLHDGGSVARALAKQTNTLSDPATIASRLTDTQLKALGIKPEQVAALMKPLLERAQSRQTTPINREQRLEIRAAAMVDLLRTDPSFRKAMDGVKDVIFGLKGDIEGGRVQGERSRDILDNALNRLRSRTEDSLLGLQENTPTPKKEAKVEKLAETMPESAKVLRALTGKPQEASAPSENVLEALTLLHEDDYKEIPESERSKMKALREAYIDSKHPQHTRAVKALHELLNQEN